MMENCLLILLVLLLVFGHTVNSQVSFVRLTAPLHVRYQLDSLILSCNPQSILSSDSISDIILKKNSTTGWRNIVKVLSDISTGTLEQRVIWTDTDVQSRANITTAIVAPTTQAALQIEISTLNVTCSDEGMYQCEINGNRGSGGGKLDSQSYPGQVTITAEPAHGVYTSQLIRYSRACDAYADFGDRGRLLTSKLMNQRFLEIKLKSSPRTSCGLQLNTSNTVSSSSLLILMVGLQYFM